jgi:hypothetical protein
MSSCVDCLVAARRHFHNAIVVHKHLSKISILWQFQVCSQISYNSVQHQVARLGIVRPRVVPVCPSSLLKKLQRRHEVMVGYIGVVRTDFQRPDNVSSSSRVLTDFNQTVVQQIVCDRSVVSVVIIDIAGYVHILITLTMYIEYV